MDKPFFNVVDLDSALEMQDRFQAIGAEPVRLETALGKVLADPLTASENVPAFSRSTMDGFAVRAKDTYGASDQNPQYLTMRGSIKMGQRPDMKLGPLETAAISTGGMLPPGADAVVMVEYTQMLDHETVEIMRSAAPGENVLEKGEDAALGEILLPAGVVLRPQDLGFMASMGVVRPKVRRRPKVGIISTGDEVVPADQTPLCGQIRDVNSYTLAGQVASAGAKPVLYGLVKDNEKDLFNVCETAWRECDMLLISGGSSVGYRDFTLSAMSKLPNSEILFHGVGISPGKPTILADAGGKPIFGLPGHVTSAMVVFSILARPFIHQLMGCSVSDPWSTPVPARLTRNLPSVQGRVEFVRVRLMEKNGERMARPVLGKSGLLRTMVEADGLIRIGKDTEGLVQNSRVAVLPF